LLISGTIRGKRNGEAKGVKRESAPDVEGGSFILWKPKGRRLRRLEPKHEGGKWKGRLGRTQP